MHCSAHYTVLLQAARERERETMTIPQEEAVGKEREEKQIMKKNNKKLEPIIEGIASSIRVVPHFPKPGTIALFIIYSYYLSSNVYTIALLPSNYAPEALAFG